MDLLIHDNGIGFSFEDVEKESSSKLTAGLNNIRQRTKMLNGESTIESVINKGTTIKITVPL